MKTSLAYENFNDALIYNGVSVSSEHASFLSANTESFKPRYKTWRTQGYFEVTAANKGIVFRDDNSNNITANIAEGEYTSISAFMTAVDAAFEAAGVAAYSVTQNTTTGKFVFTSDLSGGATHFQLITTNAGFTAAEMLGLDTGSNLTGASTYTSDTLSIHTSEWLEIDFGIQRNPNAVILIGKRNQVINISENAVLKVQLNDTSNWTSPEFEVDLTWGEWAIWAFTSGGLFGGARRYCRIYIEDPTNTDLRLEISKIFVGNIYETERGAIQFGFEEQMIDLTVNVETESGAVFSNIKPKRSNLNFEYKALTKNDMDDIRYLWEEYGISKPFFILLDPDAVMSAEAQTFIRYVRFATAPSFEIESPNNWSARVSLREEV